MTETITGQLEKITFLNQENDYTVARFRVAGTEESATVVGHLSGVRAGEFLSLTGAWQQHPRFGAQFAVEGYDFIRPETVQGIENYLASGMLKGIGPKTAEAIVAAFGLQTLEVIDRDPEKLILVPGLGKKRIGMIRQAWETQRGVRRVMVFLQGYGLGGALAARIYREYGDQAVEIVSANPYRLADEVRGIGFVTADRIARSLGIPENSSLRIACGMAHVLESAEREGHTCLPLKIFLSRVSALLGLAGQTLDPVFRRQVELGKLVLEPGPDQGDDFVFSALCHQAEVTVARSLVRLISHDEPSLWSSHGSTDQMALDLSAFELETGIAFSGEQRAAVLGALSSPVTVITGGPGTGKTTIIAAIVSLLQRRDASVVLAAPTGRSAKRMAEAASSPASTIHRLLGWNFPNGGFIHNANRLLDGDVFVVDEVSMVDVLLLASLVQALPHSAALILLGDVDQLPSIGPGRVLANLIDSRVLPVFRLQEVFRQARKSQIILNAHRVRTGRMPVQAREENRIVETGRVGETGQAETDFFLVHQPDPEKVRELIVRLATERLRARFGLDPSADLQVITPMNKGPCGTRELNLLLQQALNPEGERISFTARPFRVGDRVMQVRNVYEKDVFNGDVGRIIGVNRDLSTVLVDFDGRIVPYEALDLEDLEIAYAVTVHKSQGSEYPAVIIPLVREHHVMLQRNLLYTALSRGQRLVVLIGDPRAIERAVSNARVQVRHTRLAGRLRAAVSAAGL